jgi:hypothetical protein
MLSRESDGAGLIPERERCVAGGHIGILAAARADMRSHSSAYGTVPIRAVGLPPATSAERNGACHRAAA